MRQVFDSQTGNVCFVSRDVCFVSGDVLPREENCADELKKMMSAIPNSL